MLIRVKYFIKRSIIGGLLVILPIVIFLIVIRWLFDFITSLIQPLTDVLIHSTGLHEFVSDMLVIILIVTLCFVLGTVVSTKAGRWLHNLFDKYLARLAPGYRVIKDIVSQFLGDKSQSPFANGQFALVKLFGPNSETTVSAIVTSQHKNGNYTVFMPTGPNPTSGNIYHVKPSQVEIRDDIRIEDAFRTIIACGAGSGELMIKNQIN